MKMNHISAWDKCLLQIKSKLSAQPVTFDTWFKPIKAISLSADVLTIQVPNPFFFEFLEENYISLLSSALKGVLGTKARLEYQFRSTEGMEGLQKRIDRGFEADKIENHFVIPGIKKHRVDPQLNKRYLFENFVEGDCNRLARSAGLAIADRPGKTAFNPLFVFGDVGLGKTHIAQAIGNEIVEKHKELSVLYISTEEFMNETINAIRKNSVDKMLDFYLALDVLIVDDIQFMDGKAKLQEIFFNIFNRLHQRNKQIILTSDKAPKDLNGLEDRMISRFKWGLSADLQKPDLETRMAIFENKMEEHGVVASRQVVEYICHNLKDNIRELEGVLISLIAQSSLNGKEIDLNLAKKVVLNFISDIQTEITVEGIQATVSEHFNVSIDIIRGRSRKREVVIARQMSMYLSKRLTSKAFKQIGMEFGRDHSTVIHSCNTIENLLASDPSVKAAYKSLEKKIRMNVNV